jgi:hypothetical protein
MGQAPVKRGGKTAAAGLTAASRGPDAPATPRRGRPKGTGINDAETLATIVAFMAADQDLKPTTAIKKAGVTDPSIVRRLREKLKGSADIMSAPANTPKPAEPAVRKSSPQSIALAAALADAVAQRPAKPVAQKAGPKADLNVGVPRPPSAQSPDTPEPRAANVAAAPTAKPVAGAPTARTEKQSGQSSETVAPETVADTDGDETSAEQRQADTLPHSLLPDSMGRAADILRASVETAAAITRLQMDLFEQTLHLSTLSLLLKQQKSLDMAMSAALAAQQKHASPKKDQA